MGSIFGRADYGRKISGRIQEWTEIPEGGFGPLGPTKFPEGGLFPPDFQQTFVPHG